MPREDNNRQRQNDARTDAETTYGDDSLQAMRASREPRDNEQRRDETKRS